MGFGGKSDAAGSAWELALLNWGQWRAYQYGRLRATWPQGLLVALLVLFVAAAAMGLYGRFAGLGIWPLGVDEFYMSRSIDHVLQFGLPQFPCGGFYTRGLIYQYIVALLRYAAGLSPELAGRLVSAVSSVAGLPAAYLIGRRLHGRALGLLMLIILSVSVWEIEMARFARMYAPFQSIFLWYLVFFLRYSVDGKKSALAAMVALSVIGVLTWEGGALLGVTNLLPPLLHLKEGRLRRADWIYLIGMLALCCLLLAATSDLRGFASMPPDVTEAATSSGLHARMLDTLARLYPYVGWSAIFIVIPLVCALRSISWIWGLRARRLALIGLSVTLVAALCHQFVLSLAVLALLLLTGLVRPSEIMDRSARPFVIALSVSVIFWLIFGGVSGAWNDIEPGTTATSGRWIALAEHLGGFPHVFGEMLRPWARTLPLLTTGAILLLSALIIRTSSRPLDESAVVSTLLIVLLVLMLAVGSRSPGRIETRYTFFLYPLILALCLCALMQFTEALLGRSPAALSLGALLGLAFFCSTEDFQPAHVARIDSRQVNFRIGMRGHFAEHYYPRDDNRLVGEWLTQHVRPTDAVIIGIPTIDQYYGHANFFFLESDDPRYESYACNAGMTERWTNLPLLYGADALATVVATGKRVFLLLYRDRLAEMLEEGKRRQWRQQLIWIAPDLGEAAILINPS
jgi:hypothetical protein